MIWSDDIGGAVARHAFTACGRAFEVGERLTRDEVLALGEAGGFVWLQGLFQMERLEVLPRKGVS